MQNQLEKKIEKYHYRLELIRTISPLIVILLQCIILYKLFFGG
jgi:hypothetical protein